MLGHQLRSKRKFRHAKGHKPGSGQQIVEGVSIRERPAAVEDRAVPGHWEGDLICGSKNSYIATVVERQTRFTILVKVDGKKIDRVVPALARQMTELPDRLKQSLTWDRGTELASHQKFTVSTVIDVYFCDPSSPWQRGTNENTDGLLRQYFPKGSCLFSYSQEQLDEIANHLNNRPRKTLGFLTTARRLEQVL
nr:IS30 family transposase [Ahrensia kielensis]